MHTQISTITLLVADYDAAIEYYTGILGFAVLEDIPAGEAKRWVVIAPTRASSLRLLLVQATSDSDHAALGKQAGDHVFLILNTSDFAQDYAAMQASGVCFLEKPRHEPYGTVAIFKDLYGNKWDLLQPKE
ncbi:MAG: VOC family protein [Kordiimonadaceae bacterium]|nr:VOC family protein [Kordiimonadaceae bacterium]